MRELLVAVFVASSLGLRGVPVWSRIDDVTAMALTVSAAVTCQKVSRVQVPFLACIALFLFVSLLGALPEWYGGGGFLKATAVQWIGAAATAVILADLGSVRALAWGAFTALLLNVTAVATGFDSFARYGTDMTYVSEFDLRNRSSGLVGNANLLAMTACFCWWILWLSRPALLPASRLVILAGVATCALASGSRKGLMMLCIVLAHYLFRGLFQGRSRAFQAGRWVRAFLVAASLSLIAALSYPIWSQLEPTDLYSVERLYRGFQGLDGSAIERGWLGLRAFDLIEASPLVGHGFDAFRFKSSYGLYTHSNVLELLVSGGVVLACAYYGIYVSALRASAHLIGFSRAAKLLAPILLMLAIAEVASVVMNTAIVPITLATLVSLAWHEDGIEHLISTGGGGR